jgi:hypothetical protein
MYNFITEENGSRCLRTWCEGECLALIVRVNWMLETNASEFQLFTYIRVTKPGRLRHMDHAACVGRSELRSEL